MTDDPIRQHAYEVAAEALDDDGPFNDDWFAKGEPDVRQLARIVVDALWGLETDDEGGTFETMAEALQWLATPGSVQVLLRKEQELEAEVERLRAAVEERWLSYDEAGHPEPGWTVVDSGRLDELEAAEAEVERLRVALGDERTRGWRERALADELAEALEAAQVNIADWGAYASAYIQEKWDLKGDLAACEEPLAKWREARG